MYAGVPPPAVTVALPVAPPLHLTGVLVVDAVRTGGCVIVAVAVITVLLKTQVI